MAKKADRIYACEPWCIVENTWTPEKNLVGESVFSLANEYVGVRAYAEEGADAPSLIGSYFGGVYEWGPKAGPGGYKGIVKQTHYMVCAADFLHLRLTQGERRILQDASAEDYSRALDLRTGLLSRSYTTALPVGGSIRLTFERLLGMERPSYAAQRIILTADRDTELCMELAVDGGVRHQSNGQCRWKKLEELSDGPRCGVRYQTDSTEQTVAYLFSVETDAPMTPIREEHRLGVRLTLSLKANVPVCVVRRICNEVNAEALNIARLAEAPSFDGLLAENTRHWASFWKKSDVEIEGDALNQQGIRYCLFQLHQTYRGLDGHHNIGAKGLTGEAYNGHAFWDSETYCLPYYLHNDRLAARSLLLYRYHTLEQAKARARELDCQGACYPIATLNGYEACNLWQHASLQMQPSTAVAYAIMVYAELSGDEEFLFREGLEMLVEISRYVVSRGGWNADHTGFGFWGVMGPDEFHMMVNNNFYTNYMGGKTLRDTLDVLSRAGNPDDYTTPEERREWREIADHIIIHETEEGVIEQHDGYFTLPHIDIHAIPISDFPLYEHWSYDRIYRTDMIKQPDVLMALFLHPEDFTEKQLRANYDYYEPRCIHESSLSPSIHAILAQRLHRDQAAADFFSFATRMDLDNYNRNTTEGLHLTSIAAAWVTIVYGFGGLKIEGSTVSIAPKLPSGWHSYSFRFLAGDGVVKVQVDKDGCHLSMLEGTKARIKLNGQWKEIVS